MDKQVDVIKSGGWTRLTSLAPVPSVVPGRRWFLPTGVELWGRPADLGPVPPTIVVALREKNCIKWLNEQLYLII